MRYLIIALYSFFFCTQVQAQKTRTLEKTLLWEISGNGLTAPSYLFGTYHLRGRGFVDSLPNVQKSFSKCKAVAGEFIIDKYISKKMSYAMTSPINTLDRIFSAGEYHLIADYVKENLNLDITSLNELKPAAVEVLILQAIAPKTTSAKNPPLDQYFQDEGKARKYKLIGLETVDDQINLLFNEPMADQKRHLLLIIHKKDYLKKEMRKIYVLYQQQDLNGFSKEMQISDDYTRAEIDRLLKNRNIKWIKELPEIMKATPTFIAVGAAHLVGDYGLINQLRLKSYTVTAIKN